MKTTNNAQKTVNGQVKSMVLRVSAVLFSLVLISLTTVSAQDFWKQFITESNYGKMAVQLVEQSSETKKADAVIDAIQAELDAQLIHTAEAFVAETEVEEKLEVEAWMMDDTYFSAKSNLFTDEKDEELKVEDWMISKLNFSNRNTVYADEAEPALQLESWMMDDTHFSANTMMFNDEKDEELIVEDWMISNVYFSCQSELFADDTEPALEIESWMTDQKFFGTTRVLTAGK
jgi:hypothetical protein